MPEIVRKNPVNDPTQKPVKTHSKFTPNYSQYAGHQFGLNTPHFVAAGVADDDISMRVTADADTFNLKAPLMQPLKRNMDYFQLPMRALLPNAAEYIITNPLRGDDVVAATVNSVVTPTMVYNLQSKFLLPLGYTSDSSDTIDTVLSLFFRAYQWFQLLFSNGSLAKHLGISALGNNRVKYTIGTFPGTEVGYVSMDRVFAAGMQTIDDYIANHDGYLEIQLTDISFTSASGNDPFNVSGSTVQVKIGRAYTKTFDLTGVNGTITFSTVRQFCEYLLESNMRLYNVQTSYLGGNPGSSLLPNFTAGSDSYLKAFVELLFPNSTVVSCQIETPTLSHNINLLRLVAYQKACAEFYTNDKIDAVYSARLWEDNQKAIAHYICNQGSTSNRYFMLNGVSIELDSCSGAMLSYVISKVSNIEYASGNALNYACFAYLHNLFAFTRSLKYEDYFVGAKSNPLAVGDVTVGVDTGTNTVDIIDVSHKIQVQRFLNQVNRVGRKFSDYVKGILGDRPMKDVHEPIFLGHVTDTIGAEETDNTGSDQLTKAQTTTSKLRNNSSRYGFDVHIGEPSIIIGITNYDIPRVYNYVNDREIYHVDRYDAFNPFMQFVGDQEIYSDEIKPRRSVTQTFGYTMRYMEYKQRVDRAVGAFCEPEVLPGFARVYDVDEIPENIDPDFLRAHVGEIDSFYTSLSGYTPANLFQFIVRLDIEVTANRPMAFAPSIL